MADVFVSYKKEDRPIAERLVEALRAAGKSVWWDDALNPNQAWDAMIEAEIAASRHVIVLWTPRSVQSDWVRSEALYAQDHGKLVPVIAEACSLPIAFMLRQAVDLSSGHFDERDPNWDRLKGWLEGEPGAVADNRAAEIAAVPVKAPTKSRWLGPAARRPVVAIGAVAAVVAVIAVSALLVSSAHFGAPPKPAVVIDPLTASNTKGLPDGFARAVSNEMFAGFSSSSRIDPVVGDGRRRPNAYQLTGDIVTTGDNVQVFARLYAPGDDAPVLTTKLERPASNKTLPMEFGLDLAELVRCVATASDSNGSKLTVLPPDAMGPWASFCQQRLVGSFTPEAVEGSLRSVVAAAPDFANGWSNLSEALFRRAISGSSDKAELINEAGKTADRAIAINPTTAKALLVKSWLALGVLGSADSPSMLGRMHNFERWEVLARKSVSVRPSDCGCEAPQYAQTLEVLGRASAALPLMEQAVLMDPNELGHARLLAELMAITGRPGDADNLMSDLSAKWPDSKSLPRHRFEQALWRKDWIAAKKLVEALDNSAVKQAYPKLLDALARNDMVSARAAGAPFIALTSTPETTTYYAIMGLAAAGYTDELVDALQTLISSDSMFDMSVAYTPSFAAARKTAKFAALAEKMGLIDYWKMPGHRPDFCKEPNPAALCETISKT